MMHAYDEMYLEKARIALGRMFDFVVYQLGYSIEKFFDLFISSGVSRRFENGDVDLLVDFNKAEVEDYFTNFFDLKYALQNLFGRNVDLVEEQTIRNPYLKQSIDASKTLVYGINPIL